MLEECPKKLVTQFGCSTLEDVYFKLSEAQNKCFNNDIETVTEDNVLNCPSTSVDTKESYKVCCL